MKIILLISFLFMGFAYSTPVETSEFSENSNDELFMMSIYNYLNTKCPSENDSTKNVIEILIGVGDCLSSLGRKSSEPLTTASKFCQHPENIEEIPECFLPVVDIVRNCGDDEEKYLPDFILDTIKNTLVFLCANGEENMKRFTEESAITCLDKIEQEHKLTLLCVGEGEGGFIGMLADGVLTKKKLCDAMEAEKVCHVNFMEKTCPDVTDLKELFGELLDVMGSPCSK